MGAALRIFAILALSATAGLVNAVVLKRQPLVPDLDELRRHAEWAKSVAIELDAFRAEAESGGVAVLDARDPRDYEKGRLKALLIKNVPPGTATMELADRLRQLGLPIVIYCSSATCESAEDVYHELTGLAYFDQLRIYFPGWKGIEEARVPIDSGPPGASVLDYDMPGLAPDAMPPADGAADENPDETSAGDDAEAQP